MRGQFSLSLRSGQLLPVLENPRLRLLILERTGVLKRIEGERREGATRTITERGQLVEGKREVQTPKTEDEEGIQHQERHSLHSRDPEDQEPG